MDNTLFNQKFRNNLHKTISIVLIFSGIVSAIQAAIIYAMIYFNDYSYVIYVQVSEWYIVN